MRKAIRIEHTLLAAAPYLTVLLAIVVGAEVIGAWQNGATVQPGLLHGFTHVVDAAQHSAMGGVERLDRAVCDTLEELEYACTRGLM
jgi:hypothetical protein